MEAADDEPDRAPGAVGRAVDDRITVGNVEIAGCVLGAPQARELVFLGRRIVDLLVVACDLLVVACDLLVVSCDLLFLGRDLALGLGELLLARRQIDVVLRNLRPELLLVHREQPVLAGPALVVHSEPSGSEKRRSWWWTRCASLSRFVAR